MRQEQPFDDRLSGYLDGELPASEAAAFDRELAANPALRQVRDDLLSLRTELKALPVQRPPAGLNDRILAALAATEDKPTEVTVSLPARVPGRSLPAWATFSMGMLASAALMLLGFLTLSNNRPQGEKALIAKNDNQLTRPERAEGEAVNPSISTEIVDHVGPASDVPQIAEALRKGADRAGVLHVLRLPMSVGQLRGGALDKALVAEKYVVSGALNRKELLPHIALAYRSLPQSRLVAGEESVRHPIGEIIYLDLPVDRVNATLTALAAQSATDRLTPEVRVAMAPNLIEVASAHHAVRSGEAEGEAGSKAKSAKGDTDSNVSDSAQPLAIRIGAKQLKSTLGGNANEGEFAGPADEAVDVLVFVRLIGK